MATETAEIALRAADAEGSPPPLQTAEIGLRAADDEKSPPPRKKRELVVPRRLHSVRETCDAAHLSHATAWRLISRGVLRVTKIGRRTFVQDESLQRLIEEGSL